MYNFSTTWYIQYSLTSKTYSTTELSIRTTDSDGNDADTYSLIDWAMETWSPFDDVSITFTKQGNRISTDGPNVFYVGDLNTQVSAGSYMSEVRIKATD